MKRLLLLLCFTLVSLTGYTQPTFSISLEPLDIPGLGGLQSYAFGTANGKWLIVGGRLDGLHRRQPWASFDLAGHNTLLVVVDPVAQQRWTASLIGLPASIQEQLSSTNMQFHQEGNTLYLLGGYGYSATEGDHMTFPYLTAIDIAETMDAIINYGAYADHIRQIEDPQFAVTGGRLVRIDETYYLVGGQKFDGRYNPHNHPSFVQVYTDAVRRFTLNDDGQEISITHLTPWVDSEQLHRRDYNVVPQIFPDGTLGATAFSGVFQEEVDLPFLNAVDITAAGYTPTTDFNQLFNHYHCPTLPVYSTSGNSMHTVFFGGMAQFYEMDGELIQDDNVPFVRSIAVVSRSSEGQLLETLLSVEMPDLLGSGAEFIPLAGTPMLSNDIIDLDALDETELVGYIYGGIHSTAENIFWINDGTQSSAHTQIYEVRIVKENSTSTEATPARKQLFLQAHPNPTSGKLSLQFYLPYDSPVKISIYDNQGQLISQVDGLSENYQPGTHQIDLQLDQYSTAGNFLIVLDTNQGSVTQKVLLQ
jgi:hypothetical protein